MLFYNHIPGHFYFYPKVFLQPDVGEIFFFLILSFLTIEVIQYMAPHSSTLAWKIPWMEKPGRLQSMRWLRVGHD